MPSCMFNTQYKTIGSRLLDSLRYIFPKYFQGVTGRNIDRHLILFEEMLTNEVSQFC